MKKVLGLLIIISLLFILGCDLADYPDRVNINDPQIKETVKKDWYENYFRHVYIKANLNGNTLSMTCSLKDDVLQQNGFKKRDFPFTDQDILGYELRFSPATTQKYATEPRYVPVNCSPESFGYSTTYTLNTPIEGKAISRDIQQDFQTLKTATGNTWNSTYNKGFIYRIYTVLNTKNKNGMNWVVCSYDEIFIGTESNTPKIVIYPTRNYYEYSDWE